MKPLSVSAKRNILRPLAASIALAVPLIVCADPLDVARRTDVTETITTCADAGAGSLRDAITNAVDNETIDLSHLQCSPITLTTGELASPVAASYLHIVGPAAGITIDAANHSRVLEHTGVGTLYLDNVTLTRGLAGGAQGGGCLLTQGELIAHSSTFSSCTFNASANTPVRGGGIYAHGNALLYFSSVSGNRLQASHASSDGGGIAGSLVSLHYSSVADNMNNCAYGQTCRGGGVYANGGSAQESTISGNRAYSGAGIYSVGFFTVDQSTISGNKAGDVAGGLFLKSNGQIVASTIAFNTATFPGGAGIYMISGTTALIGSIVARNTVDDGLTNADIAGAPGSALSGSNDLIMASSLAVPAFTTTLDPLLGPLQNNGGPTKTHAIDECSPAASAGSQGSETHLWDQRGPPYQRVVSVSMDIGAFEARPDFIFGNGFEGREARPNAIEICL
ncbi:MAG: choice-of-anchor Q domain-containing protein [Rudaea sp.]